jgi:hypothetical protein
LPRKYKFKLLKVKKRRKVEEKTIPHFGTKEGKERHSKDKKTQYVADKKSG